MRQPDEMLQMRSIPAILLLLVLVLLVTACQHPGGRHHPVFVSPESVMQTQHGVASIYRDLRTASGERFNAVALTAAHRIWPMGTRARVTHLKTGRQVIVRINDRGPFIRRRIIDVSAGAAEAIGIKSDGVGQVRMDVLDLEG